MKALVVSLIFMQIHIGIAKHASLLHP
jgi:hypothetical protein